MTKNMSINSEVNIGNSRKRAEQAVQTEQTVQAEQADNILPMSYHKANTRKFMIKYYALIAVELLCAGTFITICDKTDVGVWVANCSEIALIVAFISLAARYPNDNMENVPNTRRLNLILTISMVLSDSYFITYVTMAKFDAEPAYIILIELGLVCVSLILFAIQTKFDFTAVNGLFFVVPILLISSIINGVMFCIETFVLPCLYILQAIFLSITLWYMHKLIDRKLNLTNEITLKM